MNIGSADELKCVVHQVTPDGAIAARVRKFHEAGSCRVGQRRQFVSGWRDHDRPELSVPSMARRCALTVHKFSIVASYWFFLFSTYEAARSAVVCFRGTPGGWYEGLSPLASEVPAVCAMLEQTGVVAAGRAPLLCVAHQCSGAPML